jgi:hypothetical protein
MSKKSEDSSGISVHVIRNKETKEYSIYSSVLTELCEEMGDPAYGPVKPDERPDGPVCHPVDRATRRTGRLNGRLTGPGAGFCRLVRFAQKFNHKIMQKLINLNIYYSVVEWKMCIVVRDTLKA